MFYKNSIQKLIFYLKGKTEIIKYIISGSLGGFVDLSLLYFFTDILHWWYLLATVVAFVVALIVSFIFQKYWTFQNKSHDNIHIQVSFYIILALINLGINTFLMYVFVDLIYIWYMFAQIISSLLIAVNSFFIYKHHIFKK